MELNNVFETLDCELLTTCQSQDNYFDELPKKYVYRLRNHLATRHNGVSRNSDLLCALLLYSCAAASLGCKLIVITILYEYRYDHICLTIFSSFYNASWYALWFVKFYSLSEIAYNEWILFEVSL